MPEEHIHRLKAVISKLRAAGLKLKPTKCDLFKQQINYLGHVVSKEGVSTDPDKITAVTEWPQPTTVTEVRSFLGFVSYYRRFIPNFSKVAKPLNQLLQNLEGTPSQKKKFKVYWGPEQQEAFETLQKLCTKSPILAYADFKAPFVLHTDASGDGLGAVLYQVQDGQKRVIAYASRSLSKSERNYPVHKLEFLALKWAITDKFHEYLYGSEFQVFTDNNPLTYVLTTAKLDATGHRWVAALSNYMLALLTSLARAMWMQMHYLASGGLKPLTLIHRQCMLSVRGCRPHMAKWKPFARGPKQWMHCVKTMPHQA